MALGNHNLDFILNSLSFIKSLILLYLIFFNYKRCVLITGVTSEAWQHEGPLDLSPWSYKLNSCNSTKDSLCNIQTYLRYLCIETSESGQIWANRGGGRKKNRHGYHRLSPEFTATDTARSSLPVSGERSILWPQAFLPQYIICLISI